ncbi:MAG: hypothetical protein CM1200mP26_16110 [Acidimicrobiales bacterium]|nr:MAG: hypothetical protein CM1200mP26_16110 [Acidimicrobiales bacterium]
MPVGDGSAASPGVRADPVVPSLFDLFPGTEAMERRPGTWWVWPSTAIPITPGSYARGLGGPSLRRDVAIGAIPVQFKDAPGPPDDRRDEPRSGRGDG